MAKNMWLILSFMLALILAACSPAPQDTSLLAAPASPAATQPARSTPSEVRTIALVMKTLTNPFFVEMEKGARQAEKELGIQLIVKTGAQETSVEQQITIIEELINAQVDAILIAPADSIQLIPVLKKAQEAGIVIINVDNQLDAQASAELGLTGVPFISVNNEQGAYLSAKHISASINAPTQAMILEGIPTAKNAQDRKAGALRAFAENPHIEVVASETAHWKIDEAYQVTEKLLGQHPDVKLVFCANDMMAFGVIQYLQKNQIGGVQVAAYDALAEAMPMLRDGSLQATIDQQAALQAYTAVQYAIRALDKEPLPPITLLDVMLVTRENAR
ncbi:MAG: sugar ABC transporter substrate-binding protein [Chloroflexota bacterium]